MRAEAASSVDHRTGNRIEEAGARRDVLDHGQGIEVPLVGSLGELRTAVQIGNALAYLKE